MSPEKELEIIKTVLEEYSNETRKVFRYTWREELTDRAKAVRELLDVIENRKSEPRSLGQRPPPIPAEVFDKRTGGGTDRSLHGTGVCGLTSGLI